MNINQQMKKQHTRAIGLPFAEFLRNASKGALPPATYTVKYDGFCIIVKTDGTNRTYFNKKEEPIRITSTPQNIMEAIVLELNTKFQPIDPLTITYSKMGRDHKERHIQAKKLYVEFTAMSGGISNLRALFHKECLSKDAPKGQVSLDWQRFTFEPIIYDARFTPKTDLDPPYFERLMSIQQSLDLQNQMLCPSEIDGVDEMLDVLLKEEGLVCHRMLRNPSGLWDEQAFKIKMPKVVLKARILAVANTLQDTLDDFHGFNLILIGVPRADGAWSAIHCFDWSELFTKFERPGQGRAFIPPQNVKRLANGAVICKGKGSMQPLVDAVFRAASCTPKKPATRLTSTETTVDRELIVVRGKNRQFVLDPGYLFLTEHVPVTIGCSQLWDLKGDEIHLQPAWLLAVGGEEEAYFGDPNYRAIADYTRLDLLLRIAKDKPNPHEAYRMVGMTTGPFLGLEREIRRNMTAENFLMD